ncbi:MAG TPA: HNH endonuclease signature motif containing protein [Pyrinomonadaceae bacterium]|jgi:hypothetical protein|nr:HNH endonuclease signature motif containing protein [Pyrinomonadaceae bacterium]
MGKTTPSQAKNAIRRALLGILDSHPNAFQTHQIWAFFDSSCAYCGRALVRGNRDAHLDHLVSMGTGGSNALGNFVLSCSICNGDEKRDEHWESFLRKKVSDETTYKMRREQIANWIASCSTTIICDSSILADVHQEVDRAISAFDAALHNIRELKKGGE